MSYDSTEQIIRERVFSVTQSDFQSLCLEVFEFQYNNNPLYHSYCKFRQRQPKTVQSITDIPFLPIRFFKQHLIQTGSFHPEIIFESSGTTGSIPSRHAVKSLAWYERSFIKTFHETYGDPSNWCILALLPSYLERQHSSLVYMTEKLIEMSKHPNSGFYLYEHDQLADTILKLENEGQKTILLGVAFALLDFSLAFEFPLKHTTVIETGGMKGRKQEITKQALHEQLQHAWKSNSIHSEYGMTELISQAYSSGSGIFETPNQLRICVRAEDDPTLISDVSSTINSPLQGGINIIDLHNLYTCCFIETEDYGTLYPDGKFRIDGRLDNSDLRGCGLMIA
jgi:phenylacetate-coenzyme A ligase PaaK-like adenylate-forming protein